MHRAAQKPEKMRGLARKGRNQPPPGFGIPLGGRGGLCLLTFGSLRSDDGGESVYGAR